jgi:hypothetical protein
MMPTWKRSNEDGRQCLAGARRVLRRMESRFVACSGRAGILANRLESPVGCAGAADNLNGRSRFLSVVGKIPIDTGLPAMFNNC